MSKTYRQDLKKGDHFSYDLLGGAGKTPHWEVISAGEDEYLRSPHQRYPSDGALPVKVFKRGVADEELLAQVEGVEKRTSMTPEQREAWSSALRTRLREDGGAHPWRKPPVVMGGTVPEDHEYNATPQEIVRINGGGRP